MIATISIYPDALLRAKSVFEGAGFLFEMAPLHMQAHGVVTTAYRVSDGEGYLLSAAEVRLVAQHGLAALDSNWEIPKPRWEKGKNREHLYCEAALANAVQEMQQTGVGVRNETLNRLTYGLARLEHLGLNALRTREAMFEAATSVGLTQLEAQATIKTAWAKGLQSPFDLAPNPAPQPTAKTPQAAHLDRLRKKHRGNR